jgi:hypothetical protein
VEGLEIEQLGVREGSITTYRDKPTYGLKDLLSPIIAEDYPLNKQVTSKYTQP